jgi:hypothetical protein
MSTKKKVVKESMDKSVKSSPKGYFTLVDVCKVVKMDPKDARRYMRKPDSGFKKDKDGSWTFPTSKRQAVIAYLKS